MNYKIDIIIPAYNVAEKITVLLRSLEVQDCTDFRAIIIDDGSTDGTYDCCCRFSEKSPYPMLILKQENQGPGIARRTGIKRSDANYVMFCDADDYLHEATVGRLLDILGKEPLDILEFGFQKITEHGQAIASTNLTDEKVVENCLGHYIKQRNTTNYLCNKIFRRQLLKESDFKKLYYSEDARALTLIFSRCTFYRVISDKYYFYVINDNSACGKPYDLKRLDTIQADKEICSFIEKKDSGLLPFAACTSCVHIAKIYSGLKKTELLNGELKEALKAAFRRRYHELNTGKREVYRIRSRKQILAVELFRISPSLFSALVR